MTTFISIASLTIALAAVIVGPFISSRIARKQTLLPMRLQWIESLRRVIVDFLATLQVFQLKREHFTMNDLFETVNKLLLVKYTMSLMINPEEELHKKLTALTDDLTQTLQSSPSEENYTECQDLITDLLAVSRQILKREWDRIGQWKG